MARYIPRSDGDKHHRVAAEKMRIYQRFPGFATRIMGKQLLSRGDIRPTETSEVYRVEISYEPWCAPEVRIIKPAITPERQLHFYDNGTLCLYDHREQPWQQKWWIADTVIPWTAEWLVYYEIYLLTGKWIGPSAVHGSVEKDQPVTPIETKEENGNN